VLKTLTKTQCQSLKCTKAAGILLLLFLVMFSENRESFPHTHTHLPPEIPCTNGNFRSKNHNGKNGGKGQNQGWQKNGSSPFFCATGIHHPATAASRGTLNMITSTFLPFLSQLEEQPCKATLSAPAVKHAKVSYAMKQAPETHALTGNLCTLERHFNTKICSEAVIFVYKRDLQFLSPAT